MTLASMPAEGTPGARAGLELYELAASGDVPERLVEHRCRNLLEMLTSDPQSVFDIVPLPASGADGLRFTASVRDDLGGKLAAATKNLEGIGHDECPPEKGDSAGER